MGSKFLAEVDDSTKNARLIPFEFSNEQAYVLEFGHELIRVYKNQALIESGGNPIEIVTPYDHEDLALLNWAQSADVIYFTHPDYSPKKLSRTSDTVWTFEDADFEDGPYRVQLAADKEITLWLTSITHTATITSTAADFHSSDVGKYVEFWKDGSLILGLITTYVDNYTVTITPKENVIDMNSLDHAAVITYDAGYNEIQSTLAIWSSETEYHFIKVSGTWYYMSYHVPFPRQMGRAPNQVSMDCMSEVPASAPTMKTVTGALTMTNEVITATLKASQDLFDDPNDVGRHFKLNLTSRSVWGWITSVTSAKQAAVRLGHRVPTDPRDGTTYLNNATSSDWKLGAWFVGNYPRYCTFHQGRLVFAGTYLEPNRVWMSESDDFISFATANSFNEVLDSSGLNFGIVSGEVNTIAWMQSGPVLLIGTLGEEFQVKPPSLGEALTSTNLNVTVQTPYGSKIGLRPTKIGPSTLFIQRHGKIVRELIYSFEIDSFVAADVTIASEHIFKKHGAAIDFVYQQTPNSLLWFVCEDGQVLSLTYEKDQQVYAWSAHSFVNGEVESIAIIPNESTNQDDLYLLVKRTIDGRTVRYVEVLNSEFYPKDEDDKDNMRFLDCYLEYSGVATDTISGLDHLEGEEVSVLADGAVHPNVTVSGGEVTLDREVTNAVIGYAYCSLIETLPQEGGSETGTVHGRTRKLVDVDAQVLNSIGLKYGPDRDNLRLYTFRRPSDPMGESPPLFTGFKRLTSEVGFDVDCRFVIAQDQPYPLHLLSVMSTIKINE